MAQPTKLASTCRYTFAITLGDKSENILKAIRLAEQKIQSENILKVIWLAEQKIQIYIITKMPDSQGGGCQNSGHGSCQKYKDQSADGKSKLKGHPNG
eukprot:TRINITY_DN4512_c0_g2_i2.p1 TRINITY_DN4512_c0_g2~~TRINITY_DN4512_c0_g2_i2.p1  ORF type:complete len:115 (-),score=8.62 TRINITY_DN4512_c0_g2_i2:1665-1958(-)